MTLTTIPLNRITAPDAINARPRTDAELAALAAAGDAEPARPAKKRRAA